MKTKGLPRCVPITDIDALNEALDGGNEDFAIINEGGSFTRNTIWRLGKRYRMFSGTDGTVVSFTPKQLLGTFIGTAMESGRFVAIGV